MGKLEDNTLDDAGTGDARVARRRRLSRGLWHRGLPGTLVVVAALTTPEFSVGAGDFGLGRGSEFDPPEPLVSRAPAGAGRWPKFDRNPFAVADQPRRVAGLPAIVLTEPEPGASGLALPQAVEPPMATLVTDQSATLAPGRRAAPDVVQAPPRAVSGSSEPAAALAPKAQPAPTPASAASDEREAALGAPDLVRYGSAGLASATGSFTNLLPEAERAAFSVPAAGNASPERAAPPAGAVSAEALIAEPSAAVARSQSGTAAGSLKALSDPTPAPAARSMAAAPGSAPVPVAPAPTAVSSVRTAPAAATPASLSGTGSRAAALPVAPAAASAPPVAAKAAVAAPVVRTPSASPRVAAPVQPPAARAPSAPAAAAAVVPRPAPVARAPESAVQRLGVPQFEVKSQLVTRVDGKTAGAVDFQQTPSGLTVRLGSIVDVLADRYDASQLARIRGSAAGNAYVSLTDLRAQGIPISYDPVYDEFNVGLTDTRPKAARKVHMDQISTPERGAGSTGMEQVRR